MNRYLLILVVSLLCCTAAPAQQEYVIGEGDLLKITVYDQPDLITEVRVSADGRIAFPLIGEVMVSNLSVAEAEKAIARLLEEGYIIHPHVAIFISEYKSKKVTVLGEVAKPGIVVLRGASTLMEVLSDAGGITQNAGDAIVIQRKSVAGDGKKEKDEVSVVVDTKRLFEDGDVTANIPVQNGDSIYVPKAAFVYVDGPEVHHHCRRLYAQGERVPDQDHPEEREGRGNDQGEDGRSGAAGRRHPGAGESLLS